LFLGLLRLVLRLFFLCERTNVALVARLFSEPHTELVEPDEECLVGGLIATLTSNITKVDLFELPLGLLVLVKSQVQCFVANPSWKNVIVLFFSFISLLGLSISITLSRGLRLCLGLGIDLSLSFGFFIMFPVSGLTDPLNKVSVSVE